MGYQPREPDWGRILDGYLDVDVEEFLERLDGLSPETIDYYGARRRPRRIPEAVRREILNLTRPPPPSCIPQTRALFALRDATERTLGGIIPQPPPGEVLR